MCFFPVDISVKKYTSVIFWMVPYDRSFKEHTVMFFHDMHWDEEKKNPFWIESEESLPTLHYVSDTREAIVSFLLSWSSACPTNRCPETAWQFTLSWPDIRKMFWKCAYLSCWVQRWWWQNNWKNDCQRKRDEWLMHCSPKFLPVHGI